MPDRVALDVPVYEVDRPGASPGSKTLCSGCGQCCSLLALQGNHAAYRFVLAKFPAEAVTPEQRANASFILEHMHEIDINIAYQINGRRVVQDPYAHFYLCDAYDVNENLCRMYAERPPMCKGFPWYGLDPTDPRVASGLAPYHRCSFWADVPREQWPDWAEPTASPAEPLRPVNVC